MHFRLLGPLEITDAGQPAPLRPLMQRLLLAHLLLLTGRPVSNAELADRLWDGTPPRGARNTLQVHVMRLRRWLDARHSPGTRIDTGPDGYQLVLGDSELDAVRFRELVAEAARLQSGPHHQRQLAVLDQAIGTWRGPVLEGLTADWTRYPEVRELVALRDAAAERRAAARLHAGEPDAAAEELRELVRTYPDRDRLRHQLMLALCRAGRRAEALAAYQDARRYSVETLGLEPAPDLRRLHQAILRGEETYRAVS